MGASDQQNQTDSSRILDEAEKEYKRRVDARIQGITDTTRWLTTTFGAVAAVLVAGLSLSSFSGLSAASDSDYRLRLAVAGIGAAALGIVLGIGVAANVLTPALPNVEAIDDDSGRYVSDFKRRPEYLSGYRTIGDLRGALEGAASRLDVAEKARMKVWHRLAQALIDTPTDKQQIADLENTLNYATTARDMVAAEYDAVQQYLHAVLPTFQSLIIMRRFFWARFIMVPAVLLVICGVAVTAYAINPPTARPIQLNATADTPRVVIVTFSPHISSTLRAMIGADCGVSAPTRALLLGGTVDKAEVVLLPEAGCSPVRLTISQSTATLTAG